MLLIPPNLRPMSCAAKAGPCCTRNEEEQRMARGVQVLMTDVVLGESPRWHEGRLWFCDWGAREIIALDPEGDSEVVAAAPALPFCIDWLPDGRLLIVSGRDGLLLRRERDGSLVTHADLTGLAPPPWNDIVVDGRGNVYVGNTGFDFPGGEFAHGIIALVTPDGSARQVAGDVAFPNGIAVTPDNATLILAESYGNRLTAFDIADDGSLSPGRVWADLGDGVPDGICLDEEGAVWYADVPNQRCVRVREGGEALQTIDLDRGCFACMLGGVDGRTLYMVAAQWRGSTKIAEEAGTGQVLATDAPARHAGWP
jgi:sugar lactone lactonase YvrE